jgi:hypothetical protein
MKGRWLCVYSADIATVFRRLCVYSYRSNRPLGSLIGSSSSGGKQQREQQRLKELQQREQ